MWIESGIGGTSGGEGGGGSTTESLPTNKINVVNPSSESISGSATTQNTINTENKTKNTQQDTQIADLETKTNEIVKNASITSSIQGINVQATKYNNDKLLNNTISAEFNYDNNAQDRLIFTNTNNTTSSSSTYQVSVNDKLILQKKTQSMINKTIDVDMNNVVNLETDNFKNTAIATSSDNIPTYDNASDSKLTTEKNIQKVLKNIQAPANDNDATNKKYVDDLIAEISGATGIQFKGYVSENDPSTYASVNGVKENEVWYSSNSTDYPTSFPISVKTYKEGAWSSTTTELTLNTVQMWRNLNNNSVAFYIGGGWRELSTTTNIDNQTIKTNDVSQLKVANIIKTVSSLPVGNNVDGLIYRYNGNYYIHVSGSVYFQIIDSDTAQLVQNKTLNSCTIDAENNNVSNIKTSNMKNGVVLSSTGSITPALFTDQQLLTAKATNVATDVYLDGAISNVLHNNLTAGKLVDVDTNGKIQGGYNVVKADVAVATDANIYTQGRVDELFEEKPCILYTGTLSGITGKENAVYYLTTTDGSYNIGLYKFENNTWVSLPTAVSTLTLTKYTSVISVGSGTRSWRSSITVGAGEYVISATPATEGSVEICYISTGGISQSGQVVTVNGWFSSNVSISMGITIITIKGDSNINITKTGY